MLTMKLTNEMKTMLENSFMTSRLRETVLPPEMKIDLSKGTKDGTRERGNERIGRTA